MDVAETIDLGTDALLLMRAQRYAAAESLLDQQCDAASEAAEPWILLGICLIAQGKTAELFARIERRQRQTGDGLKLFYNILMRAADRLDHPLVMRAIETTPRNSLLFIVAIFVSGIVAASSGHGEQAIALFKAAREAATRCAEHFAEDPYLFSVLIEGDLLEPAEQVAREEATEWQELFGRLDALSPAAEFHGPAAVEAGEKFIFYAACDERYLDRFGEETTRALDATGARTIFHLHVVDPTAELGAKIERLRAACASLDVRYSSERVAGDWRQGYERASYYACSRLVRLPEVFARYRRDVFMWDMDTKEVKDLARLVEAMAGYDLGYFEMKNTRPSLICHLAAVYYAHTPAGVRLADVTAKHVLAKLARIPAYWLLDQSSLYCASRYLQTRLPDFRINDFHRRPGIGFYDTVRPGGSVAEKQNLRGTARGAS